jgi:hypothetical protein
LPDPNESQRRIPRAGFLVLSGLGRFQPAGIPAKFHSRNILATTKD